MSNKSKVTQQQRVCLVLHRLASLAKDMEDEEAGLFSSDLQDMLEGISCDDGFGTEGQADPRGDMRNGEWSIFRVEGLDK